MHSLRRAFNNHCTVHDRILDHQKIWHPSVEIFNALSGFKEGDIIVTAKKHGEGTLNGDNVLLKDEIYNGKEINITRSTKLTGSFYCSFDNLHLYPFDTEICSLYLKVVGNAYQFTKLIPKDIQYHGSKNLAQYVIKGDNKFREKIFLSGESGVQVTIRLGRQFPSIFMVTYLPTILINIISQATNYFEGTKFSGDIIKVNLSSMMVLAALYISISGSLPVTASVKYVDIWLIFNFLYPFIIVLAQTFIQYCRSKESSGNKVTKVFPAGNSWRPKVLNGVTGYRAGEIFAKFLLPGLGVIFTVTYFGIGVYLELKE